MTTIHTTLIQTALQALQANGEMKFQMKCGESLRTGYHKIVRCISQDELAEVAITIYMTSKSPTGFGILVQASAEVSYITLLDKHLESFENFEEAVEGDYAKEAYKAVRGRQIHRAKTGLTPFLRTTH